MTTSYITVTDLEAWLVDGAELALLDMREPGQIGEGHILFSAPAPYSRFEVMLGTLAPNLAVRMVLYDEGDGVAERAARRAHALGYAHVNVLTGGAAAWAAHGRTLFKGVNVPSKAFGELVELACHTPHISAEELQARAGEFVLIDGRPAAEYHRMTIPGAQNCPNGELALRIGSIAGDPEMPIVVNCAGRTRSIIGAQTLRDLGVPNPVYALENGTQGWTLSGFALERGAVPALAAPEAALGGRQTRAVAWATLCGAAGIDAGTLATWRMDAARTTYLLDVRTETEALNDPIPGAVHAPGGQLIQATDQWVGVRCARIVVVDGGDIRAPVVASWLARLGHQAYWLTGGSAAMAGEVEENPAIGPALPELPRVSAPEVDGGNWTVLDLRTSDAYRTEHIPGAQWATRARLEHVLGDGPHLLVADDPELAALVAVDLAEAGVTDVSVLAGGMDAWRDAGLTAEDSPAVPRDEDRIDYLFFVHDRHDGNLEASRAYLAWETGLVDQLDPRERAVFRV